MSADDSAWFDAGDQDAGDWIFIGGEAYDRDDLPQDPS